MDASTVYTDGAKVLGHKNSTKFTHIKKGTIHSNSNMGGGPVHGNHPKRERFTTTITIFIPVVLMLQIVTTTSCKTTISIKTWQSAMDKPTTT